MTKKSLSFSSKLVRDCTQKAILSEGIIKVISYVGKYAVFSYYLSIDDWKQAENALGNPNYHKRKLVEKYADPRVSYPALISVREQIIDSQIFAIEQLMK